MPYFGGKEAPGVYQRIINMIPRHTCYIEPFVGGGAIWRHLRPCGLSIVIDRDLAAVTAARRHNRPDALVLHGCGIAWLEAATWLSPTHFIYADPPYMLHTRKSSTRYPFELADSDHERLLQTLCRTSAMVVLSGYASDLYMDTLTASAREPWQHATYQAMTRGSTFATEHLWWNYGPLDRIPHRQDYRYLGDDYVERQFIRRKINRVVARLRKQPPLHRAAILEMLAQHKGPIA